MSRRLTSNLTDDESEMREVATTGLPRPTNLGSDGTEEPERVPDTETLPTSGEQTNSPIDSTRAEDAQQMEGMFVTRY